MNRGGRSQGEGPTARPDDADVLDDAAELPEPEASTSAFSDFGMNAAFVEELHGRFELDPNAVDESWNSAFGGAPSGSHREDTAESAESERARSAPAAPEVPTWVKHREPPAVANAHAVAQQPLDLRTADKYARILRLIHSYRSRGHRIANSDPLGGHSTYFPELDPAHYGFGNDDLDQPVTAGDLPGGSIQTLREILERLKTTYCGTIGAEYTHIQDPGRKEWLRQRLEQGENRPRLADEDRKQILRKLSASELFERFLHTKFVGQKRFSLEGAETTIPMLDHVVELGPSLGIRELVLGMPHRGRLNVLSNILGKSYQSIFSEFEDSPLADSPFGSGDVKYHKGYSSDRRVATGERVHMTLTSNPSHLEAVNPVVEGRTKAKQVSAGDAEGETVLPILLHGDAAFAGQGIVTETLNLSQLPGYSTGGTLHIVVNNQIGFTTTPSEARSTLYCTDVAKMIQAPIFHVNGDDPEAAIHCVELALAYRQRFGCDVVIDLVCYRRHGHNEGDEPSFTQPRLYSKIRKRPSVRKLYSDRLVATGVITQSDATDIEDRLNRTLREALETIKNRPPDPDETYEPRGLWRGYSRSRPEGETETAVPIERLAMIAEGLGALPSYFHVHPKLGAMMEKRGKSVAENSSLDWAMGEALAFGSLLLEGTPVRLSGQDCSRGTFSHRHAVFVDQDSGEEYTPLDHLSGTQARFEVYDSLLSEAAVLGFEYGYSLAAPSTLVLWEAQFGDFINGAQVIIDQFISSAHVKWGRLSGLVMLLPHGYEGQGPEHSSARVERFLQVCAEDSLQVINCTTPAQYFHALRRQMRRPYRAPLVVFTPKSLLRQPAAQSKVEDFSNGTFQRVIDDALASQQPDQVRRVLLCSGKVYYDLVRKREELLGDAAHSVAIIRVEELYPWPGEQLTQLIRCYSRTERLYWVQEEPANMGAWTFVRSRLQDALLPGEKFAYAGRPESASPAVGSARVHRHQQAALLAAAFEGFN